MAVLKYKNENGVWLPISGSGTGGSMGPQGPIGPQGPQGEPGPQGPIGPTGPQGEKGERGEQGIPGARGLDGLPGPAGESGAPGQKGDTGDKGERGEQGEQGPKGDDGKDGESAYQIARRLGYVGTEEQWVNSLKGEKGQDGEDGKDGTGVNILGTKNDQTELPLTNEAGDAYLINGEMWVYTKEGTWSNVGSIQGPKGDKGDPGNNGNDGADGEPGQDGQDGEKGDKGDPGEKGADGESAFEIARRLGKTDLEDEGEWIDSLKGSNGKDGTGVSILGTKGNEEQLPQEGNLGDAYLIDGSLYVWTAEGNWINVGSIQGPPGKDGKNGLDGSIGIDGQDGQDGRDGESAYQIAQRVNNYQGTEEDFAKDMLKRLSVEDDRIVEKPCLMFNQFEGRDGLDFDQDNPTGHLYSHLYMMIDRNDYIDIAIRHSDNNIYIRKRDGGTTFWKKVFPSEPTVDKNLNSIDFNNFQPDSNCIYDLKNELIFRNTFGSIIHIDHQSINDFYNYEWEVRFMVGEEVDSIIDAQGFWIVGDNTAKEGDKVIISACAGVIVITKVTKFS